jgi:exo-1,4-beta-D-glucosaminidase
MKKAMEPLHVMYSYKSNEVDVTNSFLEKFSGLTVRADVYDLDGKLKYSNTVKTDVDEDGIKKCFAIPTIDGLSGVYFLRLSLKDAKDKTRSINWYWLSQKSDALDWKKSKWFYTPQAGFSDFTGLGNLSPTTIDVNYSTTKKEIETLHTITLTNTGKTVAFFVHVRVLKEKNGDDILPVIFSDNYISLAPGESRAIECSYENKDAGNGVPYVLATGSNLDVAGSKAGKDAGFGK